MFRHIIKRLFTDAEGRLKASYSVRDVPTGKGFVTTDGEVYAVKDDGSIRRVRTKVSKKSRAMKRKLNKKGRAR